MIKRRTTRTGTSAEEGIVTIAMIRRQDIATWEDIATLADFIQSGRIIQVRHADSNAESMTTMQRGRTVAPMVAWSGQIHGGYVTMRRPTRRMQASRRPPTDRDRGMYV